MDAKEFYARLSGQYGEETFGLLRTSRALARAIRTETVLQMLDRHVTASAAIGDLGCGPGQFAIPVLRRGHRYIGIDISAEMIAQFRASEAVPDTPRFAVGSVLEIPLRDQSLKAVLMIGVLEYVESTPLAVLAEMRRVLTSGGIAIVSFPNLLNPVHAVRTITRPVLAPVLRAVGGRRGVGSTVYVSRVTHRSFVPRLFHRAAIHAGFEVREFKSHGFELYPMDRAIDQQRMQSLLRREQIGHRWAPGVGSNHIVCLRKG